MKHLLLPLILLTGFRVCAQADSAGMPPFPEPVRSIAILTGYNGWRNHYAELGVALHRQSMTGPALFSSACFVSAEIRPGRSTIVGTKIGAWASGGCSAMCIGLSSIWYTDGTEHSVRLRPEIGFGFGPVKVTYGYNIPFSNRDFEGVNTHTVSAAFLIDAIRLKKSSTP